MASQDVGTPPSSSSHRLPTVSASQALQRFHARGSRALPTGLPQLNKILSPLGFPGRNSQGGLVRGKVTEVYGPSGVGKTAFGIQAAVNALREGHGVVWVDAAAPLVPRRFNDVLLSTASPDELLSHFHHFTAPTLAHLLALFGHPPASFPLPNTGLVVIDSLSTLLDNAYPRSAGDRTARSQTDQTRWAAGRKFAVINDLISKLAKVAALHDIALLLTCQTITRIQGGARALLVPAISGAEWENGISTRLVLFRDWVPGQGKWNDANAPEDAARLRKARFVGVVKANGVTFAEDGGVGNVVPFAVDSTGLCELDFAAQDVAPQPVVYPSPVKPRKRPHTEIADSEDEDPDSSDLYGWVEDDEVAAEGLLVDESASANADEEIVFAAESRTDHVPDVHTKEKVTQ
ncbi:P-loop containing nucleoside triphosphate hydrolase protein [Lindgomyces ingoldianus]|uniref:P-loop containing nucleoside triphosphate hydrolase protein n=1 Tax=Lindgomyces ingoldianus TaxID=673940 RepID=A0ACB6RAY6_9PLEO|nr:P-loop containing nucleoside triphosphate hydrolase protein [Lindgomyces ingoldianus]KAF2475692.1 P-loop containing nucleoside triphosphate hydrolase protein [Lindgomyces ingoldianus]